MARYTIIAAVVTLPVAAAAARPLTGRRTDEPPFPHRPHPRTRPATVPAVAPGRLKHGAGAQCFAGSAATLGHRARHAAAIFHVMFEVGGAYRFGSWRFAFATARAHLRSESRRRTRHSSVRRGQQGDPLGMTGRCARKMGVPNRNSRFDSGRSHRGPGACSPICPHWMKPMTRSSVLFSVAAWCSPSTP